MMESNHYRENILIVDDTPENLSLLWQVLTDQGYEIRPALSGEIALKAVQKSIPDLILLDVLMPDMDGYEVCARLKADRKTKDIPIIFISSADSIEDKMQAFSEGGVDYISKPFYAEEVVTRVKTHLTFRSMVNNLEKKNIELQRALDEVNQLRTTPSICAKCKKTMEKTHE